MHEQVLAYKEGSVTNLISKPESKLGRNFFK